jgi:hypothetical protein
VDRYQTSAQTYYDRYSDPDFWQRDASTYNAGDWLFMCLVAGAIAAIFLAFRRGDYRAADRREAEDRARSEEIKREMAEIYRNKRR